MYVWRTLGGGREGVTVGVMVNLQVGACVHDHMQYGCIMLNLCIFKKNGPKSHVQLHMVTHACTNLQIDHNPRRDSLLPINVRQMNIAFLLSTNLKKVFSQLTKKHLFMFI